MRITILFLLLILGISVSAQRKVVRQKREQKTEQVKKKPYKDDRQWHERVFSLRSKGLAEVSPWHTGTAGIIRSDAAELSLFNPSRIGFTKNTELLFRIGEEPFLPNIGVKHRWWANDRFALATEHTLYYTYPLFKILQNTGFKDLVPDSVSVNHGLAMRNEFLFSWLINRRINGCPNPRPEYVLTLRGGVEFYAGMGEQEVAPFDYFHSLYHTQVLNNRELYYGGLQFDSYFSPRFHYSLNALYYNVDLTDEYAVEANLRLTYYVSERVGVSASCKFASMDVAGQSQIAFLPLLDVTWLISPGRGEIRHGLRKSHRR